MCGRFSLAVTHKSLTEHFNVKKGIFFESRYNIAPGELIPIIKIMGELEFLRWGFVPKFKANQEKEPGFINVRSETVLDKISFRQAFIRQRCLVMANGFYEWKKIGKTKQPFFVHQKDNTLFAMAGIWEGSTFGILTRAANPLIAPIHDRMPVIIPAEHYSAWLDVKTPMEKLSKLLLQPLSCEQFEVYPVSPKMNNARFESSLCVDSLQ